MGTWSEDKLKSLRAQYNFEKKNWPGNTPMVPPECELDSRGVLQWKGGKKPVVHSGYWVDPKKIAKDSSITDRRSRLHRALDCVLDSRRAAKDAYPADTRQKNMDSYEKLVWKLWNMHNKSYADVAKQLGMSTQKVRAMIDYLRGKVDEY